MTVNKVIIDKIYKYINQYIQMDVGGIVINCPYWANKIKEGKVVLRGYLNGKASAEEIRRELVKRLRERKDQDSKLTSLYIQKFAKRERIGIDCSGFAYRVLEELVRLKYANCSLLDLSEVYEDGINRTDANMLTLRDYCFKVDKISDIRLGDLIRMMSGRHVTVVLEAKESQITYVHSSHLTKIQGVHFGTIEIKNLNKSLKHQQWLEKTREGDNFGKKYFQQEKGDGIFRLKIFNQKNSSKLCFGVTLRSFRPTLHRMVQGSGGIFPSWKIPRPASWRARDDTRHLVALLRDSSLRKCFDDLYHCSKIIRRQ